MLTGTRTTNLGDITNGPMAIEGQDLIKLYQAYLQTGGSASLAQQFPELQFTTDGSAVGLDARGSGSFSSFLTSVKSLGMQVSATSTTFSTAEGFMPIAQLPTLASLPNLFAVAAAYKPQYFATYQGAAHNQALQSLNADIAAAQTGLTGAGVKVGVISDSVNQYLGGLADSVKTGDLPAGVQVLQDGAPGSTDEGRAMLENIHDIAPGASLGFSSAEGVVGGQFVVGPVTMANSITALAQAGYKVIVDDVGMAADPYFQEGIVQQAITSAVQNQNVLYFSSAGNEGANAGYLSNWRSTNANSVGSLPAGTYMNFAPSGAPVTQLPFTVSNTAFFGPSNIAMQFDQPYGAEEPGTPTNNVSSQVNLYILNAAGNVVASSISNTIQQNAPFQFAVGLGDGNYNLVIQLASGPGPAHVEAVNFSQATVAFSQQFGSAGGTFYPSSVGHNAGDTTIGVGAVPWWASSPFLNSNPLNNEGFSATGPALIVRNPDGSPKGAPVTVQNPRVSGVDGGNTSFFSPGNIINTTQSPPFFPGEPSTPTNLSQNLPSFFGTSSASPNIAAVAALLAQRTPSITSAQVATALTSGARALNGAAAGTWNTLGGYGLVDAVASLSSIDVLRVATAVPANGASLTQAPGQIVVTFNRPVDFSTVTAADLQFTSLPATVSNVVVGTPVALDDPLHPTQIAFPYSFTVVPNQLGNGAFAYTIASPKNGTQVLSFEGLNVAGKPLQPFSSTYTVLDTMDPTVVNATVNGRVITVQFSEPMNPNTITPSTVFLIRMDANGVTTNLDNDPRFKLTYNPATNTATLDFTGLNQVQLGNGTYMLVVKGGSPLPGGGFDVSVTDVVGNKLNGTFSGVFPSGTTPQTNADFVDNLGFLAVQPPVITSFTLQTASDSGILGDNNTNVNMPTFVGQVASAFPGTVQGLTVLVEFNALHGGLLNLSPLNGRGFTGSYDVQVTTDANGTFVVPAPQLPEGFQNVRLVVIGQPDSPPQAGLSTLYNYAFRIDNTAPKVVGAELIPGGATLPLGTASTPLNALTNLSIDVLDPASPSGGPLATPAAVLYPAVDPTTASNISNYSLINLDQPNSPDYSRFITSATFIPTAIDFVSPPNRTSPATPYFGRIDLTFGPGLVKGHYRFIVHTSETVNGVTYGGLTDAAGNPLDDTNVTGQTSKDFVLNLNIQPEPVYVTSVSTDVTNAQGNKLLPYSYYEINPRAGDVVSAPPTTFNIDFSNPLDPSQTYADAVQLIRSADSPTSAADGDFGNLGQAGLGSTGIGFSRVNPSGTTVTLVAGPNGINTRLVLQLPSGTVLPADHYRLYMPNSDSSGSVVKDIYGNRLDGEFLGSQAQSGIDANGNPMYEDLLPTGQYRQGMSGDGVAGGAFMTAFEVVPTGNVIYARPDYIENPLLPGTASNGTIAQPYSVLAPQAAPNALNGSTLNNGDPNGGLNSAVNFLSGFNSQYDRAGLGRFARSAFYAASQLSKAGPVVIVGLPGTPQRNPITGQVTQATFVLQAPSGSNSIINDGSGSVPFDTALVMTAGSTVKLQNASLFIQNQGASLNVQGGPNPNDRVTFTSYADDSVGGDTNRDGSNTTPKGGDWGGIVFRNFDSAIAGRTDTFPVDGVPSGPNNNPAVSGADDALSNISFANVKYAGGAVPATRGIRYDAITLLNSRPAITQDNITLSGGQTSSQASISGDLNSFREDDTRRGPLIRRDNVSQNSLNGIYVHANVDGVVEQTDAMIYPTNPVTMGGSTNFVFDAPLPYLFTSRMVIGSELLNDTTNQQLTSVTDRLYIQPGTMLKFQRGAGIEVNNPGASINVGDRNYISRFDAQATADFQTGLVTSTYGPTLADGTPNPNFVPEATTDAYVVFTSLYDNTATTSYFDPLTQRSTILVPAIDSANTGTNNPYQPTPGNVPALARWGSISLYSGAVSVVNNATIEYGGGSLNVAGGTVTRNVLTMYGSQGGQQFVFLPGGGFKLVQKFGMGSRSMITNDNFYDNAQAAIYADPDTLIATDPTRPLSSGHPFFRNNILLRNDFNALQVGQVGGLPQQGVNLTNNSLWDQTDITYLLRGTIVPARDPNYASTVIPVVPGPGATAPALTSEITPYITLTIQSALPGTVLADGSTIPKPGQSVVIKTSGAAPGDAVNGAGTGVLTSSNAGAGFEFGYDNGVDPTGDPYVDQGLNDVLRILGIGGNETTGQARVPVIITSLHDSSQTLTVRGVDQSQVITNDATRPAAGDGGAIIFGGNTTTSYNAFDLREGNRIDNVDLKYLTRIEMQGGGDMVDPLGTSSALGLDPYTLRSGTFGTLANGQPNPNNGYIQDNAPKLLTISDSNISNFSQVGVLAHPGQTIGMLVNGVRDGTVVGEPNQLFMWNDTISNSPVGVRMKGEQESNTRAPNPHDLVLLNDTFYNNGIGVDVVSINFDGTNSGSHVHVITMDNIFANNSTAAIQDAGQIQGSVEEYNLFWQNGTNINDLGAGTNSGLNGSNFQPIFGDPKFRNAAAGDLQLTEGSAAIDSGRSELNLNQTSNGAQVGALVPIADQLLTAAGGTRNSNSRLPDFISFNNANAPSNELALPGYVGRGYVDEWVPVLATDPTGVAGPDSSVGTWNYAPIDGQRDELGYLRIKDPNSPNVGFGSQPFFDLGAYEFRTFATAHVLNVTATVTDPTAPTVPATTVPLYKVGGFAGSNKVIQTIQVQFDGLLDPASVTGSTVLLEGSGGDGIFGNSNSANDKFYNLSGKLAFDPNTKILTISVGAAGLVLPSDEYRLFLLGTGSNVLTTPQGIAIDGRNTVGGLPGGAQLALPSGTGFPGSSFFDTFVLNTQAPTINPGTLTLDSSADSNIVGDAITNKNQPSFAGLISVALPQIVPLAGQVVVVDVSTKGFTSVNPLTGDPIFDRLNAGTALTDNTGHFLVTVGQDGATTGAVTNTSPLPDSPYAVGPDGLLTNPNLVTSLITGYSIARIRVLDQSGNASDRIGDTYLQFLQNGAVTKLVVDTAPPHITNFSPTTGTQIVPDKTGAVTFTFTTDKNIDPASLNASSIVVNRAGPDGILGTKDDVNVPINVNSITLKPLGGGKGPEQISFSISSGLANDLYQVTLKGSGASPITDLAGNPLAGTGTAGTDFTSNYLLYNANNQPHIWVGPASDVTDATASPGARANPYPTIGKAMAQATVGDIILVLPGVYTERVVLKAFIQLWSAAALSTDSNVLPGNAQQTVIRAPATSPTATGINTTVSAANIPFIAGVSTEVRGFSIASPLLGDPALGTLDPSTVAVSLINSAVLLDHDYIVDSNIGVHVASSGSNAPSPVIYNDGVIGNVFGVLLDDKGLSSNQFPAQIVNDTIAFNTIGVVAVDSFTSPLLGFIANTIFWQNHDLTSARQGTGVLSVVPNKLVVQSSMFSGNGPNITSPGDDAINVGNGFNPGALTTTRTDPYGNFVGNPAFVAPRDPRPGGDGPATFFLDGNFGLTAGSAAIDAANNALAPPLDFLFRGRVKIAGKGFPNTGPADVGAFEYKGSGGIPTGGFFRVAANSLSSAGTALGGMSIPASQVPTSVTLTFSDYVNRATLMPSSLVFLGPGVGSIKATSVTWINETTARFTLSGKFNTSGAVFMSIAYGSFKSLSNVPNLGYVDYFTISPASITAARVAAPASTPAPVTTGSLTPPAPAGPVSVKGKSKKKK